MSTLYIASFLVFLILSTTFSHASMALEREAIQNCVYYAPVLPEETLEMCINYLSPCNPYARGAMQSRIYYGPICN